MRRLCRLMVRLKHIPFQAVANCIKVVKPRNDEDTHEYNRNARLRLLMTLAGIGKLGEGEEARTWAVPATISTEHLHEALSSINKHMENPQDEFDGYKPSELLRRVTTTSSDEPYYEGGDPLPGFIASDSEGTDNEQEFMFPDNIRTSNPKSNALEELKKRRLSRQRRRASDASIDDALVEERRQAREAAALARRKAIKSELYVHDSDDETDQESDRLFFEQETKRREMQASSVLKALATEQQNVDPKKRKAESGGDARKKKRPKKTAADSDTENEDIASNDGDSTSDANSDDELALNKSTPISSPQVHLSEEDDDLVFITGRPKMSSAVTEKQVTTDMAAGAIEDGDEDEDPIVTQQASRRRVRAGFIIDSDDDE